MKLIATFSKNTLYFEMTTFVQYIRAYCLIHSESVVCDNSDCICKRLFIPFDNQRIPVSNLIGILNNSYKGLSNDSENNNHNWINVEQFCSTANNYSVNNRTVEKFINIIELMWLNCENKLIEYMGAKNLENREFNNVIFSVSKEVINKVIDNNQEKINTLVNKYRVEESPYFKMSQKEFETFSNLHSEYTANEESLQNTINVRKNKLLGRL